MTERVTIVPYDPEWPLMFEGERAALAEVFHGTGAEIEHVGSTAVPGLGAKPVIDVMVGVSRLADVEEKAKLLESAGYQYVPEYEAALPERRYFRKPPSRPRVYHLHCVVKGSDFWKRHLQFRDYLRIHPTVAAEYYKLKCELASRCSKAAYTEAKSSFVEGVLASAGQAP